MRLPWLTPTQARVVYNNKKMGMVLARYMDARLNAYLLITSRRRVGTFNILLLLPIIASWHSCAGTWETRGRGEGAHASFLCPLVSFAIGTKL